MTVIDITSFENADSKLDIKIKSIVDKPNVFSIDNATGYEIVNERKVSIQVEIKWVDLANNLEIVYKTISEWSIYNLGLDIGNDLLDNDFDGLIDSEDSDEIGVPRDAAKLIATNKIVEKILIRITSIW